jgi:hypothetical protein
MTFEVGKVIEVNPTLLKGASWNPTTRISDRAIRDLVTDILEKGQISPILITPNGDIVDGHRRTEACKLLLKPVLAYVLPIDGLSHEILYETCNGKTVKKIIGAAEFEIFTICPDALSKSKRDALAELIKPFSKTQMYQLSGLKCSSKTIKLAKKFSEYMKWDGSLFEIVKWMLENKQTNKTRIVIMARLYKPNSCRLIVKNNGQLEVKK